MRCRRRPDDCVYTASREEDMPQKQTAQRDRVCMWPRANHTSRRNIPKSLLRIIRRNLKHSYSQHTPATWDISVAHESSCVYETSQEYACHPPIYDLALNPVTPQHDEILTYCVLGLVPLSRRRANTAAGGNSAGIRS